MVLESTLCSTFPPQIHVIRFATPPVSRCPPPKPEFEAEILDARILDLNSWVDFLILFLVQPKRFLRTLTSLNKEVRPFFLSDKSIWSFPSFSSLSDYSIWRAWGYFSLAIIALGAFGFIVPKYYCRLGKWTRGVQTPQLKGVTVFKGPLKKFTIKKFTFQNSTQKSGNKNHCASAGPLR